MSDGIDVLVHHVAPMREGEECLSREEIVRGVDPEIRDWCAKTRGQAAILPR